MASLGQSEVPQRCHLGSGERGEVNSGSLCSDLSCDYSIGISIPLGLLIGYTKKENLVYDAVSINNSKHVNTSYVCLGSKPFSSKRNSILRTT